MMPNWKKKKCGLATDEEVLKLLKLKDPPWGFESYKKGEHG